MSRRGQLQIVPRASAQTTAVLYLRVSTKEQAERGGEAEGFSIPAQREACSRKAGQLGASVVAEFIDAGESARSADRPRLQELLRYLAEQGADFVIVHKVDRLARNRYDDAVITAQLQAVRRPAGQRHREHRPDAERPAAARHHELDRRVLLAATWRTKSSRARAEGLGRAARRTPRRSATATAASCSTAARSAPSSSTRSGHRSSGGPSRPTPAATTPSTGWPPSSKTAA